jgi:hypothetical protein
MSVPTARKVKVKNEVCRMKEKYDQYLVPVFLSSTEKREEGS